MVCNFNFELHLLSYFHLLHQISYFNAPFVPTFVTFTKLPQITYVHTVVILARDSFELCFSFPSYHIRMFSCFVTLFKMIILTASILSNCSSFKYFPTPSQILKLIYAHHRNFKD